MKRTFDIWKSIKRRIKEAKARKKYNFAKAAPINVDYIETEKGAWKK